MRQAIKNGAKFSRMVRRVQGQATVTDGRWHVGAEITYPKSGREIRLSLFRVLPSGKFFHHPEYHVTVGRVNGGKNLLEAADGYRRQV